MMLRKPVLPTLHIRLVILGVAILLAFIGASQARAVPAERNPGQDEANPTETPAPVETPLPVEMVTETATPTPTLSLDVSLNAVSPRLWLPYLVQSNAPEYGFATNYYQDQGIADHPAVIFASDFNYSDWYRRDFSNPYGSWYGTIVPDTSLHPNNKIIQIQNLKGTHSPSHITISLTKTVKQEFDKVYLRWYRKYEAGFDWSCQVKTTGVYATSPNASPAGTKPNGYDKYSVKLQVWKGSNGRGVPRLYTYHPDQAGAFGDTLNSNVKPNFMIQSGRWYSYELMLKANTPGKRDGEIKLWIDGRLVAHYTNRRFRDTGTLKINELEITAYVGGACTAPKDQKLWDDHLVLATQYIGPMPITPN